MEYFHKQKIKTIRFFPTMIKICVRNKDNNHFR